MQIKLVLIVLAALLLPLTLAGDKKCYALAMEGKDCLKFIYTQVADLRMHTQLER